MIFFFFNDTATTEIYTLSLHVALPISSTVDRLIDQFPADRQDQVRVMLSESLKGVISQTLCKRIGGGRAAAQEILLRSEEHTSELQSRQYFVCRFLLVKK